MRLPGFSAESSLYQSSGNYAMVSAGSSGDFVAGVVPSRLTNKYFFLPPPSGGGDGFLPGGGGGGGNCPPDHACCGDCVCAPPTVCYGGGPLCKCVFPPKGSGGSSGKPKPLT